MEKLIEMLQDEILAAVDDIALETEYKESLRKEKITYNKILTLYKKVLNEIAKFKHPTSILLELEKETQSLVQKVKLENFEDVSRKGKDRIYFAVSVEILKAIDVCEFKGIPLNWLKDFLKPGGGIYKHINEHWSITGSIQLPTPSNESSLNQKTWLYKLKETLQRSLFSEDGDKVKKRKDGIFERNKEEFYALIRTNNEYYGKK